MHQIDLLLFDFDGTLVDTSKSIVNAVNYSLRELSFPLRTSDEIISYVGHGLRYLLKNVSAVDDELVIDKAVSTYHDYYAQHAHAESFLYPHVIEVLDFFRTKKIAIVSNKTAASVSDLLKGLRIDHFFSDVIGGDDPQCKKPEACPIDKIVCRHAIKKENVIMVGDMSVDVMAGKNAGILTCGVMYGMGNRQELIAADPDHVIDDLLELKSIIS